MPEHKDLTGANLHEPKGVESAASGSVYVANGSGSGTWVNPLSGVVNLNLFSIHDRINDVSEAQSFFFTAPVKCVLNRLSYVLGGTLTTANSVLTVYRNGVANLQTVTVPFAGSGAGVGATTTFSPTINLLQGDVVEVRSNGASNGSFPAFVDLAFTAIV